MRRFALTLTLAAAVVAFALPTFAQAPPDPEPAPSVDALLAAAVTALQDARTGAQTGQADVDVAMAERATAEAALAAADQHVADTVAARDGSHGNVVVEHRRAHGGADGDARRTRAPTAARWVGVESERAGGGGNPRPPFYATRHRRAHSNEQGYPTRYRRGGRARSASPFATLFLAIGCTDTPAAPTLSDRSAPDCVSGCGVGARA